MNFARLEQHLELLRDEQKKLTALVEAFSAWQQDPLATADPAALNARQSFLVKEGEMIHRRLEALEYELDLFHRASAEFDDFLDDARQISGRLTEI